jgi:hypothetical protein
MRCPFCSGVAELEWQKYTGNITEYLSYYCKTCENAFTTTESDEISLRKYKVKKRSLLRKLKIKKI